MAMFSEVNVKPVINAAGNISELGGSILRAEARKAMQQVPPVYVDILELQRQLGDSIASLVGVQAAYITSGACAGLAISVAACMTAINRSAIEGLPDTAGLRSEVVVHRCQRNDWQQAVRITGARLVEFGTEHGASTSQMAETLCERTAAALYFPDHHEPSSIPLADFIRLAHEHDVPVIVDAAAELPPIENLHYYTDLGADLVLFSGGKMLRGPAGTGLVLGRRDLVEACLENGSPNMGIGRSMKVGKEEMVGLAAAVRAFVKTDMEAEKRLWEQRLESCVTLLADTPNISTRRVCPAKDNALPRIVPKLEISFQPQGGCTADEVARLLREGDPSIAVGVWQGTLLINASTLCDGDEAVLARRLTEACINGARMPSRATAD